MLNYKIIAATHKPLVKTNPIRMNTLCTYRSVDIDTILSKIVKKDFQGFLELDGSPTNIIVGSIDMPCTVAITPALDFEDDSILQILKNTLEQLLSLNKKEWVIFSPLNSENHWSTLEIRYKNNQVVSTKHDTVGGTKYYKNITLSYELEDLHTILTETLWSERGPKPEIKFKNSPYHTKRQSEYLLNSSGPIAIDEIRILTKIALGDNTENGLLEEYRPNGVPKLRAFQYELIKTEHERQQTARYILDISPKLLAVLFITLYTQFETPKSYLGLLYVGTLITAIANQAIPEPSKLIIPKSSIYNLTTDFVDTLKETFNTIDVSKKEQLLAVAAMILATGIANWK